MKRIHLLPTTFQNRLIIGVGLLLVIIIALATASLFSIQSLNSAVNKISDISSIDVVSVIKLRTQLFQLSDIVHDYVIFGESGERERFDKFSLQIENTFDDILATSVTMEQKTLIAYARQEWRGVHRTAEAILEISDPKSISAAVQMEQFDVHIGVLFNSVGSLHELIMKNAYDYQQKAQSLADHALLFISLSFGLGISIAIIITIFMLRSILIPVRLLKKGADKFGKGDLSYRVPVVSTDELGELARAFNTMAETLEKEQDALEKLAIHDGLTGLYNHREFQRRLQVEIERARRYKHYLSLLMLDIDHFKHFNDTYGHQAGDVVLRVLAVQMGKGVRTVDCIARYGGEEFVIILPEMAADKALAAAERLRKNVAANIIDIKEGQEVNITVSIGVANFPEDADSKDKLIAAADRALYAAKAAGRNKVLRAV